MAMTALKLISVNLLVTGLFILQASRVGYALDCIYNTHAGPVSDKLNVHLVAHTHDDVGWLKTVDQYYIGSNNSIQVAAVQYILDSVVEKLVENPDRKFIYVEQAFFQRWWREQTHAKKTSVRRLIESGQLEFINGGWCMHDEATAHYIDMIDQTTLGHRYIKEQFGKVPRVAWQLDPFGHSAVQGYLLTAEAGFEAVFFSRGDWQDIAKRRKDRSMEFIWRGSKSLGDSAEVFGGAMHHHYDPPEGFRYDRANPDPPIQDDEFLYDVNVEERVEAFVKAAQEQALQFRTNHVMWAMGEDFAYGNAQTWFKNMDKLIHYVNKDGRVNAFYSTPSMYLDSKHAAGETWPLKHGDFFPYADSPHNFWTGYFTSRPTVKGYVRSLGAYFQAARQLEVFVGRQYHRHGHTTDELEEAMAIAQHHDAVSGTEQQHVANDYVKRLYRGDLEATKVVSSALHSLLFPPAGQPGLPRNVNKTDSRRAVLREATDANAGTNTDKGTGAGARTHMHLHHAQKFARCALLNISYCPTSETDLSGGKTLVVVAYNALGWSRKEFIKIPVSSPAVTVTTSDGTPVASQIMPLGPISHQARSFYAQAYAGEGASVEKGWPVFQLVFEAWVPPLGFRTFHVSTAEAGSSGIAVVGIEERPQETNEEWVVTDIGAVQLTFSTATGRLSQMVNKMDGVAVQLDQGYLWYNGSNGIEAGPQASGAYIFRPNSSHPFPILPPTSQVPLRVVRGALLEEVHQTFSPWASQVVRMYRGAHQAEVHFKVGPIPIGDDFGKEVITRMTTDIKSKKTFYTDSNGRDYLKRVVDYRHDWDLNVTDPVAGNYYPVNSGIYIRDEEKDFSVLVDRSVGASSLRDGELEIMLHRRLLYDDNKGVAEPLNETVCVGTGSTPICQGLTVTGAYHLNLSPKSAAVRWRRSHGQRILSPLQLAFTTLDPEEADTWHQGHQSTFSAIKPGFELPPNVALLTLQELRDESILLRLAHLYEAGEDEEYSRLVTVDLTNLFPSNELTQVVELSLTANQLRTQMRRLKWSLDNDIVGDEQGSPNPPLRGGLHQLGTPLVELGPMEIRTFSIRLGPRSTKAA